MDYAIIRRALRQRRATRVLVLPHGTTVLRTQFAVRARAEFGEGAVFEHVPGQGYAGRQKASRAFAASRSPVIVALPHSLHRRDDLPSCDLVIVAEAHEFYA